MEQLIGLPLDPGAPPSIDPPALRSSTPDAFVRLVLDASPTLKALSHESGYWGAQSNRVARDANVPLNLIVNFSRTEEGDLTFGGGLSWYFPMTQRNQGAVAQADAQRGRADAIHGTYEPLLAARARSLYEQATLARGALAAVDANALPAAERLVDSTQQGYKAGKVEYLHVLQARRDRATAQARRLDLGRHPVAQVRRDGLSPGRSPVSGPPETPMDAVGTRETPRRAPRWVLPLLAAIAVAIAAFVYVRHRASSSAEIADAPPDVPRLEGKTIVFSPAFAKRSGVKSAAVESFALMPVVQLVGTVTFDSEHVSAAGTRISGFVTRVLKVEGDRVEKGDVLAEIESTDLGRAQAQVAVVVARKNAAERNAKREADLLSKNLTTAREEEMARAELEEQVAMLTAASHDVTALGGSGGGRLGTYFVRAPIRGSVVKRAVSAGQSVGSDLVAFRVADLDYLWIELSVFEREIGSIHVDDVVELTPTGGDSDTKLQGKVAYVGEVIDPDTRTAEIRVKVDNQARSLRPGQSVNARVRPAGLARQVTTVPVSAVTFVDGKATVFAFVGKSDTEVLVKDSEARSQRRRAPGDRRRADRRRARGLRRGLRPQERALPVGMLEKLVEASIRLRKVFLVASWWCSWRAGVGGLHAPGRRPAGRLDHPGLGADHGVRALAGRGRAHRHHPRSRTALNGVPGQRRDPEHLARRPLGGDGRLHRRDRRLVRAPAGARASALRSEGTCRARRRCPSWRPSRPGSARSTSSSCAPISTRRCSSARCSTGRSCRSCAASPASSRSTPWAVSSSSSRWSSIARASRPTS